MKADEAWAIRESILYPQAKIVGGYDDIMPTFKGLISEDGMLKLVEYVRSLGPPEGSRTSAPPAPVQTTGNSGTSRNRSACSVDRSGPIRVDRRHALRQQHLSATRGIGKRETMITATPVAKETVNYLNVKSTLKSWLLTYDHKRIGILYLLGVLFFFSIGGLFAAMIRPSTGHPYGRSGGNRTSPTSCSPCTVS